MANTPETQQEQKGPVDAYADRAFNAVKPLLIRAIALAEWAEYLDWSARLHAEGTIHTQDIVGAFKYIKRYDFLPEEFKAENGVDEPIPIGHRQTNSQPSTVGQMLEWLQPRESQRILDVGSGSGWTTALLGKIVGLTGEVIGVERIPELVEFGQANLAKYDELQTAQIQQAGEELGLPGEQPFNRILISAHLTNEWLYELYPQLSPEGGRLVAPVIPDDKLGEVNVDCDIVAVTRHGCEYVEETLASEYSFVPIIR